ncbi:hypothetical protein D9Q98_003246 [Chlorella vulgaris]|uniref:Uncharacterized protein n=1 Tax=Chlorella vulgaris TaxID=3077 RepID=A0A9D4TS89_CHLVU|nr:hypothetical protein D9Q98_003246 [Chlorella vulgaris]
MVARGSNLRAGIAGCLPAQHCSPASARRPARSGGATTAVANHVSGPSSTSSAAGGSSSSLGAGVPAQHMFATRQQRPQLGGGAFNCGGSCTTKALVLYSKGLEYARNEQWDVARRVFEKTVSECPEFVKPWISWAQMEKRCIACGDDRRWANCRTVLQRALLCNRDAPALLQAWGLMEMQRGNFLAAVLLLDRSAVLEPRNRPVLKWKPVVQARQTVGARRGQHKSTPRAS